MPNFESLRVIGVSVKPNVPAHALRIRISQLSLGLHEYHLTAEAAEIGLAENFRRVVDVDAVLDKTPRQIFLKVDLKTSGLFECDRCIEDFEQALLGRYTMFYVYDDLDTAAYPADEVQVITPDTPVLDLSEDVRQTVLLSVPLKLLCREDCRGLCPRCGANRNQRSCDCQVEAESPPWRGLEGLMNR
jgi:uncharacterized protein